MPQNNYNIRNKENKRKIKLSLKRSRSVVSINSNISDLMSTSPLIKHMSSKKTKHNLEKNPLNSCYDELSHLPQGNLTSLDIHDSKGNIVTDNEPPSNKTDISHLHFSTNRDIKTKINSSSILNIDLSKNNFVPFSKPPKTPPVKSPILDDWELYNFGPHESTNSMPNSISGSISSIVKRVAKSSRSDKSTKSSSILDKSNWENYDDNMFVVHDVVHAHRNKLQVKLSEVTHSTKRWLNIFQKRIQVDDDQQPKLDTSGNHNRFKIPAKTNKDSLINKKKKTDSPLLIRSDSNIIPQKILVPNFNENHTQSTDTHSTNTKLKMHYVKRITKQFRTVDSIEISNGAECLIGNRQIFSPNTNLKDFNNSPNYPEYIPGFSSLSIKDYLPHANSRT